MEENCHYSDSDKVFYSMLIQEKFSTEDIKYILIESSVYTKRALIRLLHEAGRRIPPELLHLKIRYNK